LQAVSFDWSELIMDESTAALVVVVVEVEAVLELVWTIVKLLGEGLRSDVRQFGRYVTGIGTQEEPRGRRMSTREASRERVTDPVADKLKLATEDQHLTRGGSAQRCLQSTISQGSSIGAAPTRGSSSWKASVETCAAPGHE
jgi:hypothetical protein